MNKERAMELMGAIDPALIEQADILMPAKRRIPKITRTVLVAACLCLALAGTAAAAVANGWIKVTDVRFYPTTHVNGAVSSYGEVRYETETRDYIPFDQFSPEAQAFPHSSTYLPQYKGFDSWDEAEEFLGVEIADNPVLDQWEPRAWALEDSRYGIKMDEANCFVTFYGLMDEPAINLEMMYDHPNGDGICHLIAAAHIDTAQYENIEGVSGMYYNCQEPISEVYVTPGGLQAIITYARLLDDDDYIICDASLQMNGAGLSLHAFQYRDADLLVPLIKDILDAYS